MRLKPGLNDFGLKYFKSWSEKNPWTMECQQDISRGAKGWQCDSMTVYLTVRQAMGDPAVRPQSLVLGTGWAWPPVVATFIYLLLADGIWPHCANMWVHCGIGLSLGCPTCQKLGETPGWWGNFTAVDCSNYMAPGPRLIRLWCFALGR